MNPDPLATEEAPGSPPSARLAPLEDPAPGESDGAAPLGDRFHVRLDQYEGPLDALLDLVKQQEINILDIPIVRITEQYLEALRQAQSLNVELSGEFVLMASTLIHIKSKTLLPTPPSLEEESEDPRDDLVQKLLEREKFLQAAQMLKEKRIIEENVWTGSADESLAPSDEEPAELQVTLFGLVKTFGEVLERLRNEPVVEFEQEPVSVSDRIRFLRDILLTADGDVQLSEILRQQASPRAVIATFLALLEMVRGQTVTVRQADLFGEIVIRKHTKFDEALDGEGQVPESDSDLEYSM